MDWLFCVLRSIGNIQAMTMHVFFISYRAGHNRFTVSWTILHSSRHCPNNLFGQDNFSRTSGPLFFSKHTPLSLQLLSKAGNQKKRPESSSTSLVHSTINHHSSNKKKASPFLLGVLVAGIAVFVAFRWQWRTSDNRTSVIQSLVCHKLHMFINKICLN